MLEPKVVDQGGRITTVGFGLSYRGSDPVNVADVTNALAGLYVERNSTIRERQASGTAAFLKAQLTDMKAKLDEQERRIGQAPHADGGGGRRPRAAQHASARQLRSPAPRDGPPRAAGPKEAEGPAPGGDAGGGPGRDAGRAARQAQAGAGRS